MFSIVFSRQLLSIMFLLSHELLLISVAIQKIHLLVLTFEDEDTSHSLNYNNFPYWDSCYITGSQKYVITTIITKLLIFKQDDPISKLWKIFQAWKSFRVLGFEGLEPMSFQLVLSCSIKGIFDLIDDIVSK